MKKNHLIITRLPAIFLKIGLITIISLHGVQAQNTPPDTQAEKMLRDFYTIYMKEFTDLSPRHEQRTKEIIEKYCTAALANKIPKLAAQTDGDPFLKAQDSDSSWAKSLTIKKDVKKTDVYIVSYRDGADVSTNIHLLVVKQNEHYKIADVW